MSAPAKSKIKIKRKPKSNVKKIPDSIAPGKGEIIEPKRVKKKITDVNDVDLGEDVDFETLVKEEYLRLQRQYRVMEDTRRIIAGKGNNLTRQGRVLERLSNQKVDLSTDLYNAQCPAFQDRDESISKSILKILEDLDNSNENIRICRINLKEMEVNVDKITKRMVEQKLKVRALYGRSMTLQQAEHKQRVLENRLYHKTTQLDTKVSRNKVLRDEINMLIRLRGVFYERLIQLKKHIGKVKLRMGEIVYLATSAYEQRDDWALRIRTIREKNDKDSKQHILELKELNRVLHNDTKLHGFMNKKTKERALTETIVQRNDRKNLKKLGEVNVILKRYSGSFRDILKYSKAKSIQYLITDYMNHQQANFSLFKVISDLTDEVKSLEDQCLIIASDIEQSNTKLNKYKEIENREVQVHVKDHKEEKSKLVSALETQSKSEKQMKEYLDMFSAIFMVAGCDKTPLMNMLGKFSGINQHNIKICVKILERRIDELVHKKQDLELRKAIEVDHHAVPHHHVGGVPGAQLPNAEKHYGGPYFPKVTTTLRAEGDDEGEDKSDHPIPLKELKKQVMEELEKLQLHQFDSRSTYGNPSNSNSVETIIHDPMSP